MTLSPHEPLRLVLTGFMGSGKTTVGRIVAEKLHWRFADLDNAVEGAAGQSVPAILASQGEPAFRQLELIALRELLAQELVVISLGGGAPETAELRALLRSHPRTHVFHLHAPLPVLLHRCAAQALDPGATSRPLLGAPQNAEARYLRRAPFYAETAHHTVDASHDSPYEVAASILQCLDSLLAEHDRS